MKWGVSFSSFCDPLLASFRLYMDTWGSEPGSHLHCVFMPFSSHYPQRNGDFQSSDKKYADIFLASSPSIDMHGQLAAFRILAGKIYTDSDSLGTSFPSSDHKRYPREKSVPNRCCYKANFLDIRHKYYMTKKLKTCSKVMMVTVHSCGLFMFCNKKLGMTFLHGKINDLRNGAKSGTKNFEI